MQRLMDSRMASHRELVERAERLMSQTPDSERFLEAYDAALASETDSLLENFCSRLSETGSKALAA